MNRFSIARHLLVNSALAVALALSVPVSAAALGGCAVETSGGGAQDGTQPGANDLVQGADNDPTAVHSGRGNIAIEVSNGVAAPAEPILESDNGNGNGPQPVPWSPPLQVRSASSEPSGSNHK